MNRHNIFNIIHIYNTIYYVMNLMNLFHWFSLRRVLEDVAFPEAFEALEMERLLEVGKNEGDRHSMERALISSSCFFWFKCFFMCFVCGVLLCVISSVWFTDDWCCACCIPCFMVALSGILRPFLRWIILQRSHEQPRNTKLCYNRSQINVKYCTWKVNVSIHAVKHY